MRHEAIYMCVWYVLLTGVYGVGDSIGMVVGLELVAGEVTVKKVGGRAFQCTTITAHCRKREWWTHEQKGGVVTEEQKGGVVKVTGEALNCVHVLQYVVD